MKSSSKKLPSTGARDYKVFLANKRIDTRFPGIEPREPHPILFPFQRDLVKWALRRGRACLFEDCGLGKTFQQIEWARQIPGNVLILAPLAVANQTILEAAKLDCEVRYCRHQSEVKKGITIANYEMLEHFEPKKFKGVVLDESSIIKHFEGKFRNRIIAGFSETPYRLACTATPAPNDHMELGNHAEFVGAMSRTEMLSMFFVHDGGETSKWRLKGHAEEEFWKWVCSWAVMIRKPSDLGYDDDGFILPPLTVEQITVESQESGSFLFPMEALTLQERIGARRDSISERVQKCAELVLASFIQNVVKLAECPTSATPSDTIAKTEPSDSSKQSNTSKSIARSEKNICAATTSPSPKNGKGRQRKIKSETRPADLDTKPIQATQQSAESNPRNATPLKSVIRDSAQSLESATRNILLSWKNRTAAARSAVEKPATGEATDSLSITVMNQNESGDCSAPTAISDLESLETIFRFSNARSHIFEPWLIWCNLNSEQENLEEKFGDLCVSIMGAMSYEEKTSRLLQWLSGERPICVSKPSIIGFGINAQHCANVAFVGLSDSWEQYYQAVRRCWRFGQTKAVSVHIITSTAEGAVVANIKRKEADADRMASEMVKHMHSINEADVKGTKITDDAYVEDVAKGANWELYLGDCVEGCKKLPDESIGFSIFSPPFASLYTYSASGRDMGNCKDTASFAEHFQFLVKELFRVMQSGRLVSFHCMNLPTSKTRDGFIGIRDFRGDLIRAFQAEGFIFHSEVCIWKDPVTAMQRTKALGLLHKQMVKDSCMSRQGIPDYLVTMRKPGENKNPVDGELDQWIGEPGFKSNGRLSIDLWQLYASPVWTDIDQSRTLQRESAREEKDERHICPTQLDVIERAMELWSNPGDTVLSPFAGIGSEGFVALQARRKFIGYELKASYWKQAAENLALAAESAQDLLVS